MRWNELLALGRPPRGTPTGRIAPTPSGPLHLGHGATFLTASLRARGQGGALILRIEDLDRARCREEFLSLALDDLRWLGLAWDEGPDVGGPRAPYLQSQRGALYLAAWEALRDRGVIYPSAASRREIALAASAPNEGDPVEPIFPSTLRPPPDTGRNLCSPGLQNWRFRVPDGRIVAFEDALRGPQRFVAGSDFGDFLVWRREGGPSYELAVVVDDLLMQITEVVRGEDLLLSTARQILLYEALESAPPAFAHAPLVRDAKGQRLAKRSGPAATLSALRLAGVDPATLFLVEDGVVRPRGNIL